MNSLMTRFRIGGGVGIPVEGPELEVLPPNMPNRFVLGEGWLNLQEPGGTSKSVSAWLPVTDALMKGLVGEHQ